MLGGRSGKYPRTAYSIMISSAPMTKAVLGTNGSKHIASKIAIVVAGRPRSR